MKHKFLQFFAEDFASEGISVGAEASVPAEQTETEGTVVTEDATATETETETNGSETTATETATGTESERDKNRDSIFADARRRAEKEQREKADAEFVRRFGNFKNPLTGEPIRSQADYFAALDAQEQMNLENELKEKGVDTSVIQQYIDNNPTVRQAREYMAQIQQQEIAKQINADVAELGKLDEGIKQFDDIPKDVVEFAQTKHLSLTESYKILNYGKMQQKNVEAERQRAVNQIKGKQHMTPMTGVATNNNEVEIPANELESWQALFPNKTHDQLRKLYNEAL